MKLVIDAVGPVAGVILAEVDGGMLFELVTDGGMLFEMLIDVEIEYEPETDFVRVSVIERLIETEAAIVKVWVLVRVNVCEVEME